MAYKVNRPCMKVMLTIGFLLLLQPVFAQYNWTELDKKLADSRQLLGNNVVCLVWKGDSLIYTHEFRNRKIVFTPQTGISSLEFPWLQVGEKI